MYRREASLTWINSLLALAQELEHARLACSDAAVRLVSTIRIWYSFAWRPSSRGLGGSVDYPAMEPRRIVAN